MGRAIAGEVSGGGGVAMTDDERPLASVRVLDLAAGDADAVTRLLADLGADVLKVEPPPGSPARRALPAVFGVSIPFALHNANKRSTVLDPGDAADRRRFFDLVGGADGQGAHSNRRRRQES